MKIVVGLGNPGEKYKNTKHNIGFITVDEWAYQNGKQFDKTMFEAVICEGTVNGEKVLFVKPQTYMNLSGNAVRPILSYFGCKPSDLLVVHDDMDLPVGKIRLRQKGSAGGQNGVKNIIRALDTQEFNRIRIGIGRPEGKVPVVNHVLMPFPKEQHEDILEAIDKSVKAIQHWLEHGDFIQTMNQFN